MNEKALDLLQKERVAVLTVLLTDGSPHAAAMHFSFVAEPFAVYIQTTNTSRKAQGLLRGEKVKAALVVGASEMDWVTLQMNGSICVLTDSAALETIHKVHYTKNPQAEQYKKDPETIFLEFKPTWWRYTDFKTQPETIIASS